MTAQVRVGDRLPDVTLWVLSPPTEDGKARQPVPVKARDLCMGKRRCILVGIPGPFTPGEGRSQSELAW